MQESHRSVRPQAGSQEETVKKREISCTLYSYIYICIYIYMNIKLIRTLSAEVKLECLNVCVCMCIYFLTVWVNWTPLTLNHFLPGFIPLSSYRTWGTWQEPQLVQCKPAVEFSRTGVLWLRPQWQDSPSSNATNHEFHSQLGIIGTYYEKSELSDLRYCNIWLTFISKKL